MRSMRWPRKDWMPDGKALVTALVMADIRVWIGIDGGGTKTKVFVIDASGDLLGSYEGQGTTNSMRPFIFFVFPLEPVHPILTRTYC